MPRFLFLLAAGMLVAMTTGSEAQVLKDDGSIEIGGRRMRCPDVPVVLDTDLPTEGMYTPGEGIYLNPELMRFHPAIVRVFMFAHECAHSTVGGDELGADCAAARQGARERWLTQEGITAVCRDLDQQLADEDHPPGDTRCANIQRCFAGAVPSKPVVATIVSPATTASPAKRQAFVGNAPAPKRLAEKLRRAASAWRASFNSDVAAN